MALRLLRPFDAAGMSSKDVGTGKAAALLALLQEDDRKLQVRTMVFPHRVVRGHGRPCVAAPWRAYARPRAYAGRAPGLACMTRPLQRVPRTPVGGRSGADTLPPLFVSPPPSLLQEHALLQLHSLIDAHWAEGSHLVQHIEALAEDTSFPARELAAAVASKVRPRATRESRAHARARTLT
jgi:hypothetical protein